MPLEGLVLGLTAIPPAVLIGCLAQSTATRFGLYDHPDGVRKLHVQATPIVGGIMVFAGIAVAWIASITLYGPIERYLAVLLAAAALALAVGLGDDRRHIGPWLRLLLLSAIPLAAMVVEPLFVVRALDSGLFGFHQGLGLLALPLSVIAVLALQNAFNMTDGMDGLFGTLALIYLGLMAPWAAEVAAEALPMMAALAAALCCVLAFNLRGKLFMGDSGSYAIAVFIGLLGCYLYNRSAGHMPGELLALWFGVPVVDMGRLFVQRMRDGRSPLSPDRDHLHHLLQALLPKWAAVATYCALVAGPGVIVAVAPRMLPPAVAIGLLGYIALTAAGLHRRNRRESAPESLRARRPGD